MYIRNRNNNANYCWGCREQITKDLSTKCFLTTDLINTSSESSLRTLCVLSLSWEGCCRCGSGRSQDAFGRVPRSAGQDSALLSQETGRDERSAAAAGRGATDARPAANGVLRATAVRVVHDPQQTPGTCTCFLWYTYSRCECNTKCKGVMQDFSSGGGANTDSEGGILGRGQQPTSPPAGSLGERCTWALPAGFGAEPRPPKGFSLLAALEDDLSWHYNIKFNC